MAGIDFAAALARLLTDRDLRARAAVDPGQLARELQLSKEDEAILCGIEPVALERQAKALVAKRRSEVSRIVPHTWRLLDANGPRLFDEYSAHHWPTGHLRHAEDALMFLRFLAGRGQSFDEIERLRIETRLSGRRRRIKLVLSGGFLGTPVLYCSWMTPRGWQERLVHFGPSRRP